MSSYFDSRLYEGETIRRYGEFHWTSHMKSWLCLVFLGIFIIGIVMFVLQQIRLRTTDFVVTDRRVMLKRGLLTADVEEITLDAIEGSHIYQNIWGRIFNFGSLRIAGRGEMEICFPVMSEPGEFRAAAEQASYAGDIEAAEIITEKLDDMQVRDKPA